MFFIFIYIYISLIATGGALAAGTVLGWTSPTEIMIRGNETHAGTEYDFDVDAETWSWVGSIMTLGAAFVCIVIGTIINMIGRKLTMLLLIIPFTIGWVLIIWASNIGMLYVGRFLLGIAGGAFCITAPMYTGEIADKDIRGSLGTYFQMMLTVGILFVYAIGAGLNAFLISIVCGCIPLVFGVIFVFMPETPLYLISKNKEDKAIKSLKWLRGNEYNYQMELDELKEQQQERVEQKVSVMAALTRRATIRALIISMGLMFFQQLSGINAVIFYTGFIFTAANSGVDATIATIIVGIMQVIATFISSIVVDKLGRRILLLLSSSIMAVCTILLGVYFYLAAQPDQSTESIGWLPIVSLCVFIVMFSIGFGPIPWMMVGELFAADIKGIAGSAAGTFNWLLAFLITKTFGTILEAIGIGETFWLFSGFSILGTVFVFFVVPETKGKSLLEIQKMLAGEKDINTENTNSTVEAKL